MNEAKTFSVLIFGAGAIGTYVGGSLALAGHPVVFIEQPSVVEELRRRGLRLDLTIEKGRRSPGIVTVDPASFLCAPSPEQALESGPFAAAIFAMKSFDTAPALEALRPWVERMPPVLCLQNGVDNEPAIAAALGPDRVIAGTVTCSIGRRAAGDVVLEKARGIGVAAGNVLSERLTGVLDAAGLNARLYPHAADMKWSKVLMNLPGSATSAIVDMTIAEVFSQPGLYELERRLSQEALAVMAAQGIHAVDLPMTPVRALAAANRLPAFVARPLLKRFVGGGRGAKMPSFHIDLHAGRKRSEVEYLHGAVVRYGEKFGVPTPVNRVLVETLLALVRGELQIAEFSRRPEKLIRRVAEAQGGA